jgi:5-formyltetrahydrofolate cyclo-ligase
MQSKNELRRIYKEKRKAIPERERLKMDDLLLIEFQRMDIPVHAATLLSYWPLKDRAEVNTHLITDYLQFRMPGLQVAYPVANFDTHELSVVLTNDDTSFKMNAHGIAEPVDGTLLPPEAVDIVLVPLLVFDEQGYRIGYGKGFYDRFLSTCRPDVLKIGFAYFEPVPPFHDIHEFDVPLSIGVTPQRLYEF